jgi:hypothetical protein
VRSAVPDRAALAAFAASNGTTVDAATAVAFAEAAADSSVPVATCSVPPVVVRSASVDAAIATFASANETSVDVSAIEAFSQFTASSANSARGPPSAYAGLGVPSGADCGRWNPTNEDSGFNAWDARDSSSGADGCRLELRRLAALHRVHLQEERDQEDRAFQAATSCTEQEALDGDGPSYYAAGVAERRLKRPSTLSFLDVSAPNDSHFKRTCRDTDRVKAGDASSDFDDPVGPSARVKYDANGMDDVASSEDTDDTDDYTEHSGSPSAMSDGGRDHSDMEDEVTSREDADDPSPCHCADLDDPPASSPAFGAAFLADVTRYVESCVQESFRAGQSDVSNSNWKSQPPLYYRTTNSSDVMTPAQIRSMHLDEIRLGRRFQAHVCKGVCKKYGSKSCRFKFPRPIILVTDFKDGVILSKRLDVDCNNYNRAIMSVMRNNHDIKLLTTGMDSKATIFYITDYVTKSDMDHVQTVTLLKVGIDKIDANEYGKAAPHVKGFSPDEDLARQRIFTFLNKLDTEVERSGQWCTLILEGLPLEYKSHSFRALSSKSFIRRALLANPVLGDVQPDVLPVAEFATPILDLENPDAEVKFTCQYDDYLHRCALPTDRLYPRAAELHLFSPYMSTIEHSAAVIELSQMCPLRYVQQVTKKPISLSHRNKTSWPSNHLRFGPDHAQYETHYQVVRDISNPCDPHPIPVFLGYSLPSRGADADGYAATLLSILTPYTDPAQLKPLKTETWEVNYDRHMADLAVVDPHRHAWMLEIVGNMESITSGKKEQALERATRDQLRQEQGLSPNDVDGPNDYDGGDIDDFPDEGEDVFTSQVPEAVLRVLPKKGPGELRHVHEAVTSLYTEVHPSIDALAVKMNTTTTRPSILDMDAREDLKARMNSFNVALQKKKDSMYNPEPRAGTDIDTEWVRKLIVDENLDEKQTAAFLVPAFHVLEIELYNLGQAFPTPLLNIPKKKQMIFSLGGEGGTGKSQVIKAFTKFLDQIKLRHTLRIGAITGVAAAQVDGSTISSMLRFGQSLKAQGKASDALRKQFESVSIFFIDEISFVGCENLQHISERLSELKNCAEPFGGMTVILAGDFYQIQPIGTVPLFRSSTHMERKRNLSSALNGYRKFREVTHSVFLETQYRMKGDDKYRSFVKRYRDGKQKPAEDDAYLQTKRICPSNPLRTGHLSGLAEDPVIIVEGNDLRYHINNTKATAMAKATKQKLLFSVAVDRSNTMDLTTKLRYDLLLMPDGSTTKYGAGLLPLLVGMPVVLKSNLGVELGLSNGTIGTIRKITLDPREVVDYGDLDTPHYLRYQPVVDVHYPMGEKKFHLDGLAAGVCPMTTAHQTKRMQFTVKRKIRGRLVHLKVQRKQLWILPAFAITVNSSQGRSLKSAIVDLSKLKHFRAEKPYVMLSRLETGKHIGVQGTWNQSLWSTKPDTTMLWYLDRFLKPLEQRTLRVVPTVKRLSKLFREVNRLTRELLALQ